MSDAATPNLPSRDFERTSRFYAALGFSEAWRDDGWMILKRGDVTLEFFPHPELDPLTSWFSCCLRLMISTPSMQLAKKLGCRRDARGNLGCTLLKSRNGAAAWVPSSTRMARLCDSFRISRYWRVMAAISEQVGLD
jgi:hypothetical protein